MGNHIYHHLCIKFPSKHGIVAVRGDQIRSKECYLNLLRKAESNINMVLLDTEMLDVLEEWLTPEQGKDVEIAEALKKKIFMMN